MSDTDVEGKGDEGVWDSAGYIKLLLFGMEYFIKEIIMILRREYGCDEGMCDIPRCAGGSTHTNR